MKQPIQVSSIRIHIPELHAWCKLDFAHVNNLINEISTEV